MTVDLSGRTYLVTGAGNGIGRATVRALVGSGARVLGTDVDAAGLEQTAAQLAGQFTAQPATQLGHELAERWSRSDVQTLVLDSTDLAAAGRVLAALAESSGGTLSGLVNVAGLDLVKPLLECDLADLDRVFRVNVGGALVMTRAAAPYLVAGSVVVNVSSSAAQTVTPGLGLYGASKAANVYLTRAWARELAERGVRVCGIAPGAVDTAMPRRMMPPGPEGERWLAEAVAATQLMPRLAHADEIAAAIRFLVSDDAGYMTGSTTVVDGGASVVS